MNAVEKLSSYITRGVYTISGPFHPFGGAVDIIVVQQQDGSYKSSPWYVRFGKFQGMLKTKEKIVTVCVNGEEAKFCMYLDHKGEAYFLKECDSTDLEDFDFSSPSSGDDVEQNDRKSKFKKAQSSDYYKENGNGKMINRTRSKRALGLAFGNKEINGGNKNTSIHRTSSLERAEIAATLLETKWSTNISSIQSTAFNDLNNHSSDYDGVEEFSDTQAINISDRIDLATNLHHVEDRTKKLISGTNEEIEHTSLENCRVNLDVKQENYDGEEVKSLTYSETSETSTICTERTSCAESETNNLVLSNSEINSIIQDSFRHSSRNNSNVISPQKSSSYEPGMIFQAQDTTEFSQELTTDMVKSENGTKIKISENLDDVQFPFSDIHSNSIEAKTMGAMPISLKGEGKTEERFERVISLSKNLTSPMNIPKSPTKFGETDLLLTKSVPIIRSQIHDLDRSNPLHTLSFSLKHNTDKSGSMSSCLSLDATSAIDHSPVDSCCEVDENKQRIDNLEMILMNQDCKALNDSSEASAPHGASWRPWPFGLKKSYTINAECSVSECTAERKKVDSPMRTRSMTSRHELERVKSTTKKVRLLTPTSEELASLNLIEGPNVVTFSFSTSMLGQQQVDARIYLWKWNTRIVISDVDGTITKSDVLGQFMPLVGKDWSQTGVAHLFSAIKENEYEFLFLSARAVSQASLTRQFLFNLRQDGKALPDGPVVISPDGLFPSLYREVIRRAPHEFKIACLEDIKSLFPPEYNPFYAGFGNRYTDEFSYLKAGIPKGKIFIINPKGEVVVNRRVDSGSYISLRALVDGMFPPATSEAEDYNPWNFWKLPPPDIDI